jgi:DNA (cytosine-5)-methyltransferase 1
MAVTGFWRHHINDHAQRECGLVRSPEFVVDNFAGAGGASAGIEAGLGRHVDFAINHDPEAIAMHRVNHPHTHHFCESVWDVDPRRLSPGSRLGLGWFSPDCTYHSRARGGKPFRDRNRSRRVRGLAWLVHRWVNARRPRIIMLENVEEFAEWGPLLPNGQPDPKLRGTTFRRWHRQLENAGYQVDMRLLRACDYGAPTTRRRLFVIARCDGQEIVFPDATHGPGLDSPYRVAAECIDWSVPCPSIFTRERPLAEATLRRIARGVMRFVVENPRPFIVPLTHAGDYRVHGIDEPLRTITGAHRGELALIAPSIINTRNGERHGRHGEQAPRVRDILQPLSTVTAQGSQGALVAAFLAKHYTGVVGSDLRSPIDTITSKDHNALTEATLVKVDTNSGGHGADNGGNNPGRSGRVDLENAQPECAAPAGAAAPGDNGRPWIQDDRRLEGRQAIHDDGASSDMDRPQRSDSRGPADQSYRRGQGEQSSVESGVGDEQGKCGARLSDGVARDAQRCAESRCRSESAPVGGTVLLADSIETRRFANDGLQSHAHEVAAFLLCYYGTQQAPRIHNPLPTITSRDRFGLVTVTIEGEPYAIVDIGMRMLTPGELFRAQGFRPDYVIDPQINGKPLTKTAQVRMVGNSVPPPVAAALVRANMIEQQEQRVT